jgi:hypothetical protein
MTTMRIMFIVGALAAAPLHAQTPQLRDPWVPDTVKSKRASAGPEEHATQGETLRLQVERKLRQAFDTADVEGVGSITLQQARAAGLGRIAKSFAEIDVEGTGRITFEDYKRHLRARGAAL